MSDRETGTVKWFNDSKGYGFIQRENDECLCSFSSYKDEGDGYKTLKENQKVEFSVAEGEKGPTAEGVTPV